jgi:hypothetical protein
MFASGVGETPRPDAGSAKDSRVVAARVLVSSHHAAPNTSLVVPAGADM